MTQKELLYLEDAIEHEKNIISICQETINYLQNEELINCLEDELNGHRNTKEKLMNILEVKANE